MLHSLLILVAGMFAIAPQPQRAPEISGAAVLVESRNVPTLILRVTNLADIGLQSVDVQVQVGDRLVDKHWSAAMPLGHGGTGEVALASLGAEGALPVAVKLAVFADGSLAGDPAEVARRQTASINLADDLVAWREVLRGMSDLPNADAVRRLREAVNGRQQAHPNDWSGVRRLVEVWLREDRPAGFFAAMVTNEVKTIDERLRAPGPIAAAARRSPGPRPQNDLTSLVRAVTTIGMVREFTVSVRNDREVPLESWAVVLNDAKTGRRLRVFGHDTGRDVANGESMVGIAPAGSRVVGTYQPQADLSGDVRAHLDFVMWRDLAWKGNQRDHQRVLANRERLAQEYDFFIPSLRASASLPAAQALAQLHARQAEFRAGPLGRQSFGLELQLDEWTRLAANAPEDLSARVRAHADALDRARPSLLRHRAQ